MGYQNLRIEFLMIMLLNRFAINSLDVIFIGILSNGSQNKIRNQII